MGRLSGRPDTIKSSFQSEVLNVFFLEYPPMQKGASYNFETVKAKIEEAMQKQGQQLQCHNPTGVSQGSPAEFSTR